MKIATRVTLALAVTATFAVSQQRPAAPASVRLYILDCGTIVSMNPANYSLKLEEIKGPLDFVTPCYLVVHPRGSMVWDVGQIPDANMPASGPGTAGVFHTSQKLLPQLAKLGYTQANITYMAMSHYHSDHSANGNEFANGPTWLVQEAERAAMFAEPPPRLGTVQDFIKLKDAKTTIIRGGADHDVFGDGTVILKSAPGHTPGHQMLFLRLKKFGPLLLAGDLYHYPEERTLDRVPSFDTDAAQTRASRQKVEQLLKETGAKLWIQHDMAAGEKLKKAPEFYD